MAVVLSLCPWFEEGAVEAKPHASWAERPDVGKRNFLCP